MYWQAWPMAKTKLVYLVFPTVVGVSLANNALDAIFEPCNSLSTLVTHVACINIVLYIQC